MSTELIPFTPCSKCCEITCSAPTMHWASRSASKTKCGSPEYGAPSDPPKIYRRQDNSVEFVTNGGSFTAHIPGNEECGCQHFTYTSSFDFPEDFAPRWFLYDLETCEFTESPDGVGQFGDNPIIFTQHQSSDLVWVPGGEPCEDQHNSSTDPYIGSALELPLTIIDQTHEECIREIIVNSAVEQTCEGGGTDLLYVYLRLKQSWALSLEYTTDDLTDQVFGALPDDYPNSTSGSYYNLTEDELSLSIRESKYWWAFPTPITRNRPNPCYKIEWTERFTPLVGDTVDTPMSWTWDGVIPEGYDPDDSDTWPITPEFLIAIPSANSTTTVVDVIHSCDDCE